MFKGFDEKQGIDVAWSKIEADSNGLSHDQMKSIVDEISYGLGLDHPHIIKVRRRGSRGAPAAAAVRMAGRAGRSAAGWSKFGTAWHPVPHLKQVLPALSTARASRSCTSPSAVLSVLGGPGAWVHQHDH